MNQAEACKRRRLAQQGPFHVDYCDCGTLHVSLGAMTVRLAPSGCVDLALALTLALRNLADVNAEVVQ